MKTNNTTRRPTMSKADALKLAADFAHLVSAIRYDNDLRPQDENRFWELINKLPQDIKESVIN
jgi:hypothetical protein